MALISLIGTLFLAMIPSYLFTRLGVLMYYCFYCFLILSACLRAYFLHGFTKLYYSHMIMLELTLIYKTATQSGVLDFIEGFSLWFIQVVCFLVSFCFKYSSVTTQRNN